MQGLREQQKVGRSWQHRGRCLKCLAKFAGYRRLRRCACGGRVSYR